MTNARDMHLGVSLRGLGYHVAAWLRPDTPAGAQLSLQHYVEAASLAEAARFDLVFFADGSALRDVDEPKGSLHRSSRNAEFEPLTLLAALAARTSRIGLVATASTTWNEPWNLARKFASLDHLSAGRAGWNMVTSWSDLEARNFGRDTHPDSGTRHRRAREFIEVVTGLWDSWEDDAIVNDKPSATFFDPAKLHVLDHRGEHFQVRGPLTVPRTPQGRPVLFQAGASEEGQELAAATADVVYSSSYDLGSAQAFYASVKGRMARHGRKRDALKILPGIVPYVAETAAGARRKLEELQDLVPPQLGLALLYGRLGDLSSFDVDGPLPPIDISGARSGAGRLVALARRDGLTIRQLYLTMAAGNGVRPLIGTPGTIADDMETWLRSGAADGFNICPPHVPGSLRDFIELVLPELRRRGLFRTDYEGTTLREHLRLPAAPSRYGMARPELRDL